MTDNFDQRQTETEQSLLPQMPAQPGGGGKANSNGSGKFAILNTPFAIFVASSVVLPILIWSFAAWQNYYMKQRDRTEYIERLDIEIAYRLAKNWCTLVHEKDFAKFSRKLDAATGAFPEFNGWNMVALLFFLEKKVMKEERLIINRARVAIQTPGNDYRKIEESLRVPRWQHEQLQELAQQCAPSDR